MKDPAVARNASKRLEQQLEELGGLFNAGVRSSNFKQWRQATLTVIQRIWPGDSARSERFRRVPFSAPMGRPTEKETREYYERGCGEAMSMLRALLDEIAQSGVPEARADARSAEQDPGASEDDFPTVELPPTVSSDPAAGDAAPREAAREIASNEPGQDAPPRIEASSPTLTAPTAPAKPAPDAGRVTHRHGKSSKKNGARGRLKDMLGFIDAPAAAEPPRPVAAEPPRPVVAEPPRPVAAEPPRPVAAEPPRPVAAPVVPEAPVPSVEAMAPTAESEPPAARVQAPAPESTPALERPGPRARRWRPSQVVHDVTLPEFQVPPTTIDRDPSLPDEPAQESTHVEPDPIPLPVPPEASARDEVEPGVEAVALDADAPEDSEAAERATEEFLRTSPVLTSLPRPVRRAPGPEPAPAPTTAGMRSGVALAIAALATEVDRLGVPDGHRARARAALLDLARQLDRQDLSWDALRETVYFVMEFPPLGRRVLPLLLPYLDIAA